MIGLILAILVAIIWSIGEVSYSKVSKKYDRTNIYMYTFLLRAIIYLSVVLIFKHNLFGTFNIQVLRPVLPIILCDMYASLVINIAIFNGKLSVVSPIMAAYPTLDILLGVLLLHEKATLIEIILSSIISISIILLAINQKKSKKAPHPIKGIIFSIFYMLLVAFSTYFEKSIYMTHLTVYDLYYYKGLIYTSASFFFAIVIAITPIKMKKPSFSIIRGCGITPIGNVIYSFALRYGNMLLVTPISSLYAVSTNIISELYLKEKSTIKEKICIYSIIISTIVLIILKTI